MKTITFILTIILFTVSSNNVFARKGLIGKDERVKKIQDLEVKGPIGEELFLAYKTTSQFLFFGLYLSDDGYVLGIKGQYGRYYPLSSKQINDLQEAGQLPSPLPAYKIPWTDYLIGYSLWFILPLILFRLYWVLKSKNENKSIIESPREG